jgi:hypothetical protein
LKIRNILFDISHPAHVHLFKNFIFYFKEKGYHVVVASRDKDVTNDLLSHYKINAICLTRAPSRPIQMLGELIKRNLIIFKLHRKQDFDLAFGTSMSIAHLSAVSRVKSYVFAEDDDDIAPLFSGFTYPFATGIIIPSCLRYKKWRKKRIIHNSYHELAYLHPDQFSPDRSILKKYNLDAWSYIIVRSSALKAYHDFRIKGLIGRAWSCVYDLIKDYPIISSSETQKDRVIDPWDMHHLMSFAKMLISDSQSMTMEAAVLGVPSIRYNSFVGRISVLEELEHTYGLTLGFRPGEEYRMIKKTEELLRRDLTVEWQEKRRLMLKDKINFSRFMINFFESLL